MSLFIAALSALSSLSVLCAAEQPPKLEVTSFTFTNPNYSRTAELCGRVTGKFSGATRVNVTVDPGHQAGTYVTWPGANGHFCVLMNSNSGRAEASLWDGIASPGEAVVLEARSR